MQNTRLLYLRTQWFKLKATEFMRRYAAGLMVVALVLPGAAVGDNLKVFLLALIHPLLIVSTPAGPFLPKVIWSIILYLTFMVWAKAQKTAIDGGAFTAYLHTSPMSPVTFIRTNVLMVLLANHFLWVFMLFSFYHLAFTDAAPITHTIRYLLLITLLISAQYAVVFSPKHTTLRKLGLLYFLILVLIMPLPLSWPVSLEWLRITLLFSSLVYTYFFVTTHIDNKISKKTHENISLNTLINQNFYIQMLIKSSLSSSGFRMLWMATIMIGFILTADHLKTINNDNLSPYAFIITALLAFFLSGFYLLFRDQRLVMKNFLITLPVPRFFWLKRDLTAVILISICLYLPFYFWQLNYFSHLTIIKAWVFHMYLLLVSYPLRIHAKEPTFSTFITLLVITIIYIYNFT